METGEALRLLELFRIAPGTADDALSVRGLLARFLTSGAISLAEFQTVRDIVTRKNVTDPWAYGFAAVMFLSLHGGNAFLDPSRIEGLLEKAGYVEGEPKESSDAFKTSLAEFGRRMLTAADALEGDVIVNDEGRWFFQKNLTAVKAICEAIGRRMETAEKFVGIELSDDELSAAISFVNKRTGVPYSLNPEQRSAVAKVAAQRLTVVTGGPGTGKTTVVCSFLRALFGRNAIDPVDVALAAPTARAGQRMGEAIRKQCMEFGEAKDLVRQRIESLKGQTIHSLLGGYPPNWKYTAENHLPHKLVIIDESSMVDINLMRSLLSALDDDCRLVLLGDGDQLPSVDAGAVLGDLVGGIGDEVVVKLKKSNRFRGKLAESAAAINDKAENLTEAKRWEKFRVAASDIPLRPIDGWTAPLWRKGAEDSCFTAVLPEDIRTDACHRLIVKWAEDFGLVKSAEGCLLTLAEDFPQEDDALVKGVRSPASQALFDALDRSRILTVVREGPFGVRGINELLVKKRFGGRLPANPYVKAGVPVLITRNTRERNLFNGDIGITVEGLGGMVALFPRGDEVVVCPIDLLPEHDLAYAITVHKSQGSEFDNVLVLLPNDVENPLLSRPLVYTGITRAKKRAVVMGTKAALRKALATSVERDTGIEV